MNESHLYSADFQKILNLDQAADNSCFTLNIFFLITSILSSVFIILLCLIFYKILF